MNVKKYSPCTCQARRQVSAWVDLQKAHDGELPGDLVVRTWCFHCCRLGSVPGRGTEIPHQAAAYLPPPPKEKCVKCFYSLGGSLISWFVSEMLPIEISLFLNSGFWWQRRKKQPLPMPFLLWQTQWPKYPPYRAWCQQGFPPQSVVWCLGGEQVRGRSPFSRCGSKGSEWVRDLLDFLGSVIKI